MSSPTAKDELDVLQTVITEHEKHAFTVMAFMAAVIAGLGTTVLSWKTRLSASEVLTIGISAAITFSLWTLAHRAIALRAIDRSIAIEAGLRLSPPTYTPYQVSHHLRHIGAINRLGLFLRAMGHSTFYIPLVVSVATVFGIHHLYTNNLDEGLSDSLNVAISDAAKAHMALRTSLNATKESADVSVAITATYCDMKLTKEKDSATKWSVVSARCHPVATTPESTQSAGFSLGQLAGPGPSRFTLPLADSRLMSASVCRKQISTNGPRQKKSRAV